MNASSAKTGLGLDAEVLIVGAGPVGLCLASLLGRSGISAIILEASEAIEQDLRASTFHPPTLDFLEQLDATSQLLAQGLVCPHWQIRWHPYGERAVFDLSILSDVTKHPYRLQVEQWKLSKILEQKVLALPQVDLRFSSPVMEVRQHDDFAEVHYETGGERKSLRASYVIGCDGARSVVRNSAGLSFDGVTYPETTLLATTKFPFEDHLEGLSNVTYCWKEGGQFSLLKVPGRWRVSIYPREDIPVEDQITPEALEQSFQEIIPRAEPYEIAEQRPYRVHMRIVPGYRRDRILLAGDAAHLNAPAGGMGLNGGLHDAFELAAALRAVLREGAPDGRLDLYDSRRRPVARDEVIAQADRNRARMRERDPQRRRAVMDELKATAADREKLRAMLMRSSMIDGLRRAASIQ
ncbi:MAG: FAD-dependent monooxygenase [Hyphomicrobiales bacterium]|nr:FAD-dependent monooxygenase [Hyphomicrobiales bacterium]